MAYLLLNAVSYDGEILHADAYRQCAGHMLGFMSIIEKKNLVYHTVNGDHALFHTSKTAKMIKIILLRAPWQNVNVLLSNITFIIYAVFDV